MKFISANYWQSGENASSLLLQQCRLGETEVLFACVASGETEAAGRAGGYLTGRLLEWFREIPMKRAVKNPEAFLRKEAPQLEHFLQQADFEFGQAGIGKTGLAGILCLGRDFLLFGRGSTSVFLLNRFMGKAGAEKLLGEEEFPEAKGILEVGEFPKSEGNLGAGEFTESKGPFGTGKIQICQGVMEPEVGLLLVTDTFTRAVPEKEWKEGLFVEEIQTERQVEKHLLELGSAAEKDGGRHMAAVLFYAS